MAQRKYVVIGESAFEVVFTATPAYPDAPSKILPSAAGPAGDFLIMATTLASAGLPVMMLTETGNDIPGREICRHLELAGVDISCSDRFSGATALKLNFPEGETRYDIPNPGEGFDIAWPRIEKEDLIVFGGYLALDERVHDRLWAFLSNCKDHGATLVYIPAVADPRIPRITKVMPRVFESLEIADRVITLPGDLNALYGYEDPERAYKNNISFYCTDAACISPAAPDLWTASIFGSGSCHEVPAAPTPVAVAAYLLKTIE